MTQLERIHKFLAHCGIASRRKCEEMILEGRVAVNGQVVTELGVKIDPETDRLTVDRKPVRPERKVYFLLHKPKGYTTTSSDELGRRTVMDLLDPSIKERVYPVGRLDRESEGLLVLTNDGNLAFFLTHPSCGVKKRYQVTVEGLVEDATVARMLEKGVRLGPVLIRPQFVKIIRRQSDTTVLEVLVTEGVNREVRRMFAVLDHEVKKLIRLEVGFLSLRHLPRGGMRHMTPVELKKLRTLMDKVNFDHAAEDVDPFNPLDADDTEEDSSEGDDGDNGDDVANDDKPVRGHFSLVEKREKKRRTPPPPGARGGHGKPRVKAYGGRPTRPEIREFKRRGKPDPAKGRRPQAASESFEQDRSQGRVIDINDPRRNDKLSYSRSKNPYQKQEGRFGKPRGDKPYGKPSSARPARNDRPAPRDGARRPERRDDDNRHSEYAKPRNDKPYSKPSGARSDGGYRTASRDESHRPQRRDGDSRPAGYAKPRGDKPYGKPQGKPYGKPGGFGGKTSSGGYGNQDRRQPRDRDDRPREERPFRKNERHPASARSEHPARRDGDDRGGERDFRGGSRGGSFGGRSDTRGDSRGAKPYRAPSDRRGNTPRPDHGDRPERSSGGYNTSRGDRPYGNKPGGFGKPRDNRSGAGAGKRFSGGFSERGRPGAESGAGGKPPYRKPYDKSAGNKGGYGRPSSGKPGGRDGGFGGKPSGKPRGNSGGFGGKPGKSFGGKPAGKKNTRRPDGNRKPSGPSHPLM